MPVQTAEVRAKISVALKADHPSRRNYELWRDLAAAARKGGTRGTSKLEEAVWEHLQQLRPGRFVRQHHIGRWRVDFADPARKLALEVNGCWHHSCPRCHPEGAQWPLQHKVSRNDKSKAARLKADGWKIATLWACEVSEGGSLLELSVDFALLALEEA